MFCRGMWVGASEGGGDAHPKKNKKKPKKTKPIYQFWCSDWFFWFFLGEPKCWLKPKKKQKKNQKNPKKTSFQFRILAKTNAKKKPKKNQKKNQCQFGNLKKPKKTKKKQKNQCQFADFGVATGFFGFFWVSTPPPPSEGESETKGCATRENLKL